MKEQNQKANIYAEALKYAKKILKNHFYHSKVIEKKLNERYGPEIARRVTNTLYDAGVFDDKRWIETYKRICKRKMYGINRFNQLLENKGIYKYKFEYTYDEEKVVLYKYIETITPKICRFETEKRITKLNYYLIYRGFSNYNISKINFADIIIK